MAPSNKKTRKKAGKAASIYDVARESGVSVFTVSAVVNKKAHVGKRLRERVETAIRKLNYRPNLIARSLANRRTHTIGMIVPDIGNPFFPIGGPRAAGCPPPKNANNHFFFLNNN